ncbi:MAG: type II toxin-antitoxin system VapC family toxin [Chloroflexota bacterium]
MTQERLAGFLKRHRRIGLDTSVFIYQIEGTPRYREVVNGIFEWLQGPHARAVTSTITMLEILVAPYRTGDRDRVNRFYALLSTYPHLDWVAPTLEIADRAARLRAEHRWRTPDAIQVATALVEEAGGFISNDAQLKTVAGLDLLLVDELLPSI